MACGLNLLNLWAGKDKARKTNGWAMKVSKRKRQLKNISTSRIGLWIICCLLFAGSYIQPPLYTSNQNTYFLPGLARAGFGYLQSDFLAQETDIVPVFSALVTLIHLFGHDWMFFFIFFLLAAVYAVSISAIANLSYSKDWQIDHIIPFLVILALMYGDQIMSRLAKMIPVLAQSMQVFQKLSFLSTNGVAEQSIISNYLQPSTFGVLFLASITFFLCGKYDLAILCVVVGATIHTSLILHAGILTLAYIITLVYLKDIWKAVKIGALALVLILPIAIYIGYHFFLSDTEVIRAASYIISAQIRQPHHAIISVWFSRSTYIQMVIIVSGIVLSHKNKPLFIVLLFCTSVMVCLTILQIISKNLGLALLFPWRSSTWIIPLCTAIILFNTVSLTSSIIGRITPHKIAISARKSMVILSIVLLGFLGIIGIHQTRMAVLADQDTGTIVEYAKQNSEIGQIYLIPIDFERFRLAAGLPIFVDWKSFPYRSSEIIEWYERVQLANAFYNSATSTDAAAAFLAIERTTPVTHILVQTEKKYLVGAINADVIYQDRNYVLLEIKRNSFHRSMETT